MHEILYPLLISAAITLPVYYLLEILEPYAEKLETLEKMCSQKNGMIYKTRDQSPICIKKEIIQIN